MSATYSISELWGDWREDIGAFVREGLQARPGWRGRLQRLSAAFMPSVVCCLSYRISHWLFCHGWRRVAGTWATVNHAVFGASISPASEIAGGLYLPHPSAVVLQLRAGGNLRVYAGSGVYCEPWRPLNGEPLHGAPEVGANVIIGAKSSVAGAVRLGDGAVVSFNAVVRQDVAEGASALQSPLRNYRTVGGAGREAR